MFDDTTNFQIILKSTTDADVQPSAGLTGFDPFNPDSMQIDYSREICKLRSEYFALFIYKLINSIRGAGRTGQSRNSYRQQTQMCHDKIVKSAPAHMKGWIESGGW